MTTHDYPQHPTEIPPVNVRLIEDITRTKKVRHIRTTFSQVTVGTGLGAKMLLGHAPNRIRAFIQVTTGQCFLASDQNTAAKQDNSCANITQFAGGFYLLTTDEVWAGSNVATSNIAVIQEFEETECP